MDHLLFHGTCTALVTPFQDDGIDYEAVAVLLDRQLAAGIGAIVVAGTTGEGATLTDAEKLALIRFCKEYVKDQCLIIGNSGSNCTGHAVELSVAAEENGADALLAVSPYYNKANEAGLLAHYRRIAEAANLPLILYNVPTRTGMDIPVSACKALSSIPNIAGIKEATTDIRKILNIRLECSENFGIWAGNDDMVCAAMAVGAQGVISVASNVAPEAMKGLTDTCLQGDYPKARKAQGKLLPLIDSLFCEVNPIPVKYALSRMGLMKNTCRLPLAEPSAEHATRIEQCLEDFGIL